MQEGSQSNQTISKSLNIDNMNKLDTNRDSLAFSSTDFQNQTNEIVQQTLNSVQTPKRNNLSEKSKSKNAKSAKALEIRKIKMPIKKSQIKTSELEPALTVNNRIFLIHFQMYMIFYITFIKGTRNRTYKNRRCR